MCYWRAKERESVGKLLKRLITINQRIRVEINAYFFVVFLCVFVLTVNVIFFVLSLFFFILNSFYSIETSTRWKRKTPKASHIKRLCHDSDGNEIGNKMRAILCNRSATRESLCDYYSCTFFFLFPLLSFIRYRRTRQ